MPKYSLDDLGDHVIRTATDRWLKVVGGACYNEFGCSVCLREDDEPLQQIVDRFPRLEEGQPFYLLTEPPRAAQPCATLLFRLDNGCRFRVQLDYYRLTIPFVFRSTDPRVGQASAEWTAPAGKLLARLWQQPLQISFAEDDSIRLHVGFSLTVPAQ